MTSASDEKLQLFNCFVSRVGLRTYQHPCIGLEKENGNGNSGFQASAAL